MRPSLNAPPTKSRDQEPGAPLELGKKSTGERTTLVAVRTTRGEKEVHER
ncbi:hypothetical protein ACP70R_020077 [Stipagrostis hirtigluma subsp. patula]